MIRNRMCVIALGAASTITGYAGPVSAAQHDGTWSMLAETTEGHCGTIAIGLGIKRGKIYATGGSFAFYPIQLGGHVSGGGRARIDAVAGPRTAHGTGRFGRLRGTGTWAGRGPSGLCSGFWTANRT